MIEKTHKVGPLKRIFAAIYDFFLLLGVWFLVGSIALFLNKGQTLNPILGMFLVFSSAWIFFAYFWIKGKKTLGMFVWKLEIKNLNENKKISIKQTFVRFCTNIFICAFCGLPLIQIYFRQDGLALNDILSGTKIISIN